MTRFIFFLAGALFLDLVPQSSCLAEDAHKANQPKKVPRKEDVDESEFEVHAKVISVTADGVLCTGSIKVPKDQSFVRLSEPFMVFGSFPNAVDGDTWNGTVYPAGRYQYTAANSSFRTVRAWATSPSIAVQKLYPEINGETEIKPPFNLTWRLPPATLRRLLKGAKAEVVKIVSMNGVETLEVKGLVAQSGVSGTFFDLNKTGLCRVMLEYTRPEWDQSRYVAYFGQLKTVLVKRYGEGKELVQTDETAAMLEGWIWPQSATFISLKLFKATENVPSKIQVTYSLND